MTEIDHPFLKPTVPALVLAPMDGITDGPVRAMLGATGAFSYGITEFIRVSIEVLPKKVFLRDVPELNHNGLTPTGMPVQVQLLGGDPERMAKSARVACQAGALGIDINFGCPAPTVNRHDGGASLLRSPDRIKAIVAAVREAVPITIPVSAKLRLGWDSVDSIYTNARMAAEGGASWLTIHARTKIQGYLPPVFWAPIARVRAELDIPVIANGDIWTLDDFRRCRDETGSIHFMIGRSALANPLLPYQIAKELGLNSANQPTETNWSEVLQELVWWMTQETGFTPSYAIQRMKSWLKLASRFGEFEYFDQIKYAETPDELFSALLESESHSPMLSIAG